MSPAQLRGLLIVLGMGSLAYGLYSAWDQYQLLAAIADGFSGLADAFGGQATAAVERMRMSFWKLALKQPWVWFGVVLVVAPYVIGMGRASGAGSRRM